MTDGIPWGSTGELIYSRTYSRVKHDGSRETWPETVERVVSGNLALVDDRYRLPEEREDLIRLMTDFKILPAGRHLWASGVPNAQHLFNCFSGDTRVHTDEGVFPIEKLAGETHNVLSEGGKYRPAKFDSYGEQELLEVTLKGGERFFATPDHSWVTYNSGVFYRHPTTKLEGKKLPYNPAPTPDRNDDYWEGVAHGIVYGDGSKSGNISTMVHLFGEKEELANYLVPPITDAGKTAWAFSLKKHDDRIYVGRLPAHWKALPVNPSRSYARGFIAGLIATDGYAKNGSAQINQSSAAFEIAELATLAGFIVGRVAVDREISPYSGEVSPSYRIPIRGWSIDPERDLLRPLHRLRFGKTKPTESPRTQRVESVKSTGRFEEVFCAVEPETHTITIGSGILTGQCWVSGWDERPSDHFRFTFMRLMEGGGVGANYSNSYLADYPPVQQELYVHVVCDPEHQDYEAMKQAGVLSTEYDPDWSGAFVIEDSREGWASALVDLIDTHYRDEVSHFQRVYDVSRVRAAGTKLKTFGGRASGPQPLARMLIDVCEILSHVQWSTGLNPGAKLTGIDAMEIDHAIAQCVVAGGVRRSARMAMMHWADPQIHEFINLKEMSGSHWTTNISVEVDDVFWKALDTQDDLDPKLWGQSPTAQAKDVLAAISTGMINNGEPGFWDSSLSNKGEPNLVTCTNPCGEITLEAWEPCNLGHVNLAAFVREDGSVHYWGMAQAHRLMTRFLIRATFSEVGDPKSRAVLDRNRRIGVGHFGVASYLALTGLRYSEAPANEDFKYLLRAMAERVDDESERFCHDLRIPVPVKKRTVAPTGTIAKMPGVSEGIHPIFSPYFIRRIRFNNLSDTDSLNELIEQGYEVEDDLYAPNTSVVSIPTKDSLVEAVEAIWGHSDVVESAGDLTLNEMLAFQAMYQLLWADNAVSFTANVDPERYTADDVAEQIVKFGGLLKGLTIFPEKSFEQPPYERISKAEYDAATAKDISDGVDEECSNGSCPVR